MTDLIIGLDVGTTSVKAIAFDENWKIHASTASPYKLIKPKPNYVEQDPKELWEGAVKVLKQVADSILPSDRVLGIGVSTQGATTIPIDKNGEPIENAINWMDQRAYGEEVRLPETFSQSEVYHRAGWQLNSGLPFNHIRWLRYNRKELYHSVSRFAFVNDYIINRLTGKWIMDPSSASITDLTDVRTGKWDEQLLELSGVRLEQLSPIYPSGEIVGTLLPEVAKMTHLPENLVIVNGAHDQYCSAVALGVNHPKKMMLACGTAWVLLIVPDELNDQLFSGMGISKHAIEGLWGGIYSMGGIGRNVEWFIEHFIKSFSSQIERQDAFTRFDLLISTSQLDENLPFFIPLIGGAEGSTENNGGFSGVKITHTMADLARSVLEGISFELRDIYVKVENSGLHIDEMIMVGGGAKSPFLPQIISNITGIKVIIPSIVETACRGAAELAIRGLGSEVKNKFSSNIDLQATTVNPDSSSSIIYEKRYQRYQRYKSIILQGNGA